MLVDQSILPNLVKQASDSLNSLYFFLNKRKFFLSVLLLFSGRRCRITAVRFGRVRIVFHVVLGLGLGLGRNNDDNTGEWDIFGSSLCSFCIWIDMSWGTDHLSSTEKELLVQIDLCLCASYSFLNGCQSLCVFPRVCNVVLVSTYVFHF